MTAAQPPPESGARDSYILDVDRLTLIHGLERQRVRPMAARLLEIAAGIDGARHLSADLIERLWPRGAPSNVAASLRGLVSHLCATLAARGWPNPIELGRGACLVRRLPIGVRHGTDPVAKAIRDCGHPPPAIGRYVLDTAAGVLIFGEGVRRVAPFMRRLLATLAGIGRAVPAETLIGLLWPRDEPGDALNTMKAQVSKFRSDLHAGGWPCPIVSVRVGAFRLCMPVEVRQTVIPVLFPGELRGDLRKLLYAHPDHAAAERFLELLG